MDILGVRVRSLRNVQQNGIRGIRGIAGIARGMPMKYRRGREEEGRGPFQT